MVFSFSGSADYLIRLGGCRSSLNNMALKVYVMKTVFYPNPKQRADRWSTKQAVTLARAAASLYVDLPIRPRIKPNRTARNLSSAIFLP